MVIHFVTLELEGCISSWPKFRQIAFLVLGLSKSNTNTQFLMHECNSRR